MKVTLRILFVVFVLCALSRPASAQLSYYHDSLRVSILDTSARPTGIVNGIVTTNNATANTIFGNYNVTNAIQLYPSSSQQYLRQVYLVICNCNEMELKDTLNNHSTIFWGAQPIPIPEQLAVSNLSSVKQNITLYPNPATDRITVQASEKITNIIVRDMSGRILLQQAAGLVDVHGLSTGNYMLTVQTAAGNTTELFTKN